MNQNSRMIALSIWMIASIFYAYQYILRVMPNILLDDIMLQFNISATTFGQFSGVYYIGYSLIHLPIGIMLDRFGPRKVMSACILLTVAGMLPLLFAEHWIYPIIGRAFIGIGSSAAILGVFKIIRVTFSESRFTRMLSLSVTIGLIGAIYGGGPLSYMREILGYQTVIQVFALAGLVLAFSTYWIVPEIKNIHSNALWSDIKEVLFNKKVIWTCLFAGMMVGPLEGFADVWGSAFLKHVYGLESSLAAKLPSMIFIGMCFGAPVLSLVAEKTGNYFGTIVGAGIIMFLMFFLLLTTSPTPGMISIGFALVGVACAYQILAIYKTTTFVREDVAGLTTAVANMIIMIFGYGFHSIMGFIVDVMGGPGSSHALSFGVSAIPAALMIGTAGFIFMLIQEVSGERQSAEL